jgi:hypothetical protein
VQRGRRPCGTRPGGQPFPGIERLAAVLLKKISFANKTKRMNVEDDEVLREVDVFLTDDLALQLLQFPLKPIYADSIDISSARFKSTHNKLELEVPVVLPHNYPREQLSAIPKSQKYHSASVAQDACLGAAIIKDNAMYITPIQNVLQLRPCFKNMQSFRGETVEQMEDDLVETEYPEGDGESLQQVQLKRKESDRAQSARIQSFAYIQAQEELEPWKELSVYHIGELTFFFNVKYFG